MSENTITLDATAKDVRLLVTTIRESVKAGARYAAYVVDHGVTLDNYAAHGTALAGLAYKPGPVTRLEGDKKVRTAYGNAVNSAKTGLKRALDVKAPNADVDYLAKVIAAVDSGIDHNLDAAAILRAVEQHVESLLS